MITKVTSRFEDGQLVVRSEGRNDPMRMLYIPKELAKQFFMDTKATLEEAGILAAPEAPISETTPVAETEAVVIEEATPVTPEESTSQGEKSAESPI